MVTAIIRQVELQIQLRLPDLEPKKESPKAMEKKDKAPDHDIQSARIEIPIEPQKDKTDEREKPPEPILDPQERMRHTLEEQANYIKAKGINLETDNFDFLDGKKAEVQPILVQTPQAAQITMRDVVSL